MSDKFVYLPLPLANSIRLLELAAAHDGNGLKGRLLTVDDLGKAPAFESISYVWGSRTTAGSISCLDDDGNLGTITFTGNGEDILRRVRLPTKTRLLWMDAICIDQENLSERNHQVTLISRIYAGADKVLVWLPSDDAADWANFEPVELRALLSQALLEEYPPSDNNAHARYLFARSRSPKVSRELKRIGASAWFTRAWVVQEYAFAVDCLLLWSPAEPITTSHLDGSRRELPARKRWSLTPFSEGRIQTDARDIVRLAMEHAEGWLGDKESVERTQINYQTSMIRNLMMHSRVLSAALAVDFVYSLYPIIDLYVRRSDWRPKPDYSKSKERVFHEATAAFVRLDGNISFLTQLPAVQENTMNSSCPSWVPDYSTRARDAQLVPNFYWLLQNNSNTRVSEDLSVLTIRGLHVDRVAATLPSHPTIHQVKSVEGKYKVECPSQGWLLVLRWYCLAIESSRQPVAVSAAQFFDLLTPLKEFEITALLAALVLYSVPASKGAFTDTPFMQWYRICHPYLSKKSDWNKNWTNVDRERFFSHFGPLRKEDLEANADTLANIIAQSGATGSTATELPHPTDPSLQALQTLFKTLYGPSWLLLHLSDMEFFVTESGLPGVTNGWVEDGDEVIAIEDLNCLAIVRKSADKVGFKFVGIASIHRKNPFGRERLMGEYNGWTKAERKSMHDINLI